MKKLHFENLYPPEFYHEVPHLDSRIAIKKFFDARDTMGFAQFSLSYIDDTPCTDFEKNFVKVIHLRHAIEDLNNSFDLLIQIPWMFYRVWNEFNCGGSLRSFYLKNKVEIVRNSNNWVYLAEQECSIKKLIAFLDSISSPLKQKLNDFSDTYIINPNKSFTVRTLCNTLKHNHTLSFDELYEPYDFNVNFRGKQINLRNENMDTYFEQTFFKQSNPETPIGVIRTNYSKDLEIDIEYYNSDLFRYSDCTHQSNRYKILEVLHECINYYDSIVNLFDDIYNLIYPEIILSPILLSGEKINVKKEKNIDLNKYFSEA